MPFHATPLPGCYVFEPVVFEDERGYFFESYRKTDFVSQGITAEFVQDNQSKSSYGVIRGLHYQLAPFAQAKLVRAMAGEVQDVVVDLRENSPTYGKSFSIILSADNRKQLYIPRGFAHGFAVLSPEAIFCYKCDQVYSREHEAGIFFNDPMLQITWAIPEKDIILSEKDRHLPGFTEAPKNFEYTNLQ